MPTNRELLANEITKRFIAAISGSDTDQYVKQDPSDRIFVGKLSPQSQSDAYSSNIMIKQISVDFQIPKATLNSTMLRIYPQGNFFYRIIPTLEQQREDFFHDFVGTFASGESSFDEIVGKFNSGALTAEQVAHKVQLVPVYEKIRIDRNDDYIELRVADVYNAQDEYGEIIQGSEIGKAIEKLSESLRHEVEHSGTVIPCQFRDKITIEDLLSESAWESYKHRQCRREDTTMLPNFNFSLSASFKGEGDLITATIALCNETLFGDETDNKKQSNKKDRYRINTLFNSGIKIKCFDTVLIPIELDYFDDDYKYDKHVFVLGNNCNAKYDDATKTIQTEHVPVFYQKRLKTKDTVVASFDDLINKPVETLNAIYKEMQKELARWESDFRRRTDLTDNGKRQFQAEITNFKMEVRRFKTGIDLIAQHNMVKRAFQLMNQSFKNSAKGYSSWRLFQIVFVVSLLLDVVAHEPDLMLDDDLIQKAKTDIVDILYFPTGGGKTEAFLGILVFNLFFDRLRGKKVGVTAFLKYPLRLLSVQQVQRVSNILATAEVIRQANHLEGEPFSLGYFVGEGNTPNKIDRNIKKNLLEMDQDDLDEKYRLLDSCPYCHQNTVHVVFNEEANALRHVCSNRSCASHGVLPLFMVDDDIYRSIPSVIISTVDKMTAIGFNLRFHNLISGAIYRCPKHGYTARNRCLADDCKCIPTEFETVRMKDPAPTLIIQDELHLIKESLGAYDSHYETLVEYFIKNLSGCKRGVKVIGATATISKYEEQATHLYWKNAIRFPCASPYLSENFYSKIDEDDICRIIVGYAPFGKAIVNSVAYSLQYLKRVVWELYKDPQQVLKIEGMHFDGDEAAQLKAALRLIEDYWVILQYNNVKQESNRVLQALEDPINTELLAMGAEPLTPRKMTGDDTFQEVRATLSAIEHAPSAINDLDFNMIAATSMISHGVDADRFNLMLFYGMPGNTAEYIQAYSRVGRKHTGVVIDIMRPSREKDQSYLNNFQKFHEYKDILVDSVSINRWASKAVENTLPGIIASLLLNYYEYELQYQGDLSKYSFLKTAFKTGLITEDMLKQHAYNIYKCSDNDSSNGKLYRITIDRELHDLYEAVLSSQIDAKAYLTGVFDRCGHHVMTSLRDTDKQIIVELR